MKMKRFLTSITLALALVAGVAISPIAPASALKPASFTTNKTKLTFTAKTVDGKNYSSKVLANKKPTVIWFWAPWCAICKNESAYIVAAAKKYKGKVNFLGVGALGSGEELAEFVSHTETSIFPNLNDSEGKLWNRFGIVIQPTILFIDAKGKITSKVGPSDEESLAKKLVTLTKKK
jgi:thiol-disulfide isomerase/thioredoxin